MTSSSLTSKLGAELFGTFWLVFGGCGSAIFAAKQIARAEDGSGTYQLGIGFLGVSLAFGLTVVTMAYAVGRISGGHFNPAISLGVRGERSAVVEGSSWVLDFPGRRWPARGLGAAAHREGKARILTRRAYGRERIRCAFARPLLAGSGDHR
jgi:hypothetical protein